MPTCQYANPGLKRKVLQKEHLQLHTTWLNDLVHANSLFVDLQDFIDLVSLDAFDDLYVVHTFPTCFVWVHEREGNSTCVSYNHSHVPMLLFAYCYT